VFVKGACNLFFERKAIPPTTTHLIRCVVVGGRWVFRKERGDDSMQTISAVEGVDFCLP
jgi:hypothetical protein